MPAVTVQPGGFRIDVPVGETIMAGARALGYYWPTTCGGNGECTTCACLVLDGATNLAPMSRFEAASLVEGRGRAVLATGVRLACQARVNGNVEVRRAGVLPPVAPV
ncbi:MAG: 2Fe-2S iron-sulfur cluster-binding protein [Dehalococcoidia bacterium]